MKKFVIIILLISFLLLGCASSLKKTCNKLTDAQENIQKVINSIEIMADQELITQDDLQKIKMIADTIDNVKNSACMLSESYILK